MDARRFATALAVLAAVSGSGRRVRAEQPTAAPAAPAAPTAAPAAPAAPSAKPPVAAASTKAEARQRFDEGLHLFEKGDNAAALAEFRRAYELIPNVLVLFNIGLVYAAMDRPVDAVDALDKVLDAPAGLAPAQALKARQVRADQAARIAEVTVVTDKPAVIEVDGVEVGRTPLERPLRFASGAHVLSALAPGCLPARREITLAGRTTQTLTLALLPTESSNAHLTLVVPTPGTEVLVNGQRAGLTPLPTSIAVAPGAAVIELRRSGYRSAKRTIQVDEGSNGTLTFELEEDPATPASLKGRLRVTPSEAGAIVSVDSVVRPDAPTGIALVAGPHALRVERAGFLLFERQVDVGAGAETSLVASLVPTAETRAATDESNHVQHVWGGSLIAGGAAIAAGSVILAVVAGHDVTTTEATLAQQIAIEQDPNQNCWSLNPDYAFFHCGETKAADQDAVSSAKLKRDLAYAGIGLGVVVAGVGTYLLVTGKHASEGTGLSASSFGLWTDGQTNGLTFGGRF